MSAKKDFVEIDGKYLEGGGQIVRIALSLSSILHCPVRIINIRANRPNPGLSYQLLAGLNLLSEITNAKVTGNTMNSTKVEFRPKVIKAGDYFVDTQTAASITLILQTVLPVVMYGSKVSELRIVGGTNVGMSPQVDFLTEVLRPNLERFGVAFDFELIKRGYYPLGGGICKIFVAPVKFLKPIFLTDFGQLRKVIGWCYVAGRLPISLANEMKTAACKELHQLHFKKYDITAYKELRDVAKDNSAGMTLYGVTNTNCVFGISKLGEEKEINAEEIGRSAGRKLLEMISNKVCIDSYVQDQLIIYMSLAKGFSQIRTMGPLTTHTLSAIYVAETITGIRFNMKKEKNHILLSCIGIGFSNEHSL